jgi:hypothetical protein
LRHLRIKSGPQELIYRTTQSVELSGYAAAAVDDDVEKVPAAASESCSYEKREKAVVMDLALQRQHWEETGLIGRLK